MFNSRSTDLLWSTDRDLIVPRTATQQSPRTAEMVYGPHYVHGRSYIIKSVYRRIETVYGLSLRQSTD